MARLAYPEPTAEPPLGQPFRFIPGNTLPDQVAGTLLRMEAQFLLQIGIDPAWTKRIHDPRDP
ncbi:MAG TPA: hypothetical protein VMI94_26085 [Bryobacteraceae bacterium]|nr:hypothetical protein [Bryobacteraceae bacterium]